MADGWLCDACRSFNKSRATRCYSCRVPRRAVEHDPASTAIVRSGDFAAPATPLALAVRGGARYRPSWAWRCSIAPLILAVAVLDAMFWPAAVAEPARGRQLHGQPGHGPAVGRRRAGDGHHGRGRGPVVAAGSRSAWATSRRSPVAIRASARPMRCSRRWVGGPATTGRCTSCARSSTSSVANGCGPACSSPPGGQPGSARSWCRARSSWSVELLGTWTIPWRGRGHQRLRPYLVAIAAVLAVRVLVVVEWLQLGARRELGATLAAAADGLPARPCPPPSPPPPSTAAEVSMAADPMPVEPPSPLRHPRHPSHRRCPRLTAAGAPARRERGLTRASPSPGSPWSAPSP